jgi:hypothetical protein
MSHRADLNTLERTPWALPTAPTLAAPGAAAPRHRDDDADAFEVLAWHRADGFFTGYWDDEAQQWIDCASGGVREVAPTHWANPEGPL